MASKHSYNNFINKNKQKLGLYGRRTTRYVAYCNLHKCYLEPIDITEKRCNWKECKHLKQL